MQADLSLLSGSAEPKVGKNGKEYWTIVFSVEIHFGLTEFKARIKWVDNVRFFSRLTYAPPPSLADAIYMPGEHQIVSRYLRICDEL